MSYSKNSVVTFLHSIYDCLPLFPCTVPFFLFPLSLFLFPWDMGLFGALGRSCKLISVLEILVRSLFLGEDDCEGVPRDRLPEKGSDVVIQFHGEPGPERTAPYVAQSCICANRAIRTR